MIANYNRAVIESINTLQDYYDLNQAPIDLSIILNSLSRTIRLCSYTEYAKIYNLSIKDIIDYFESDLGACIYNKKQEKYIILFNDTQNNPQLDRFTIAHELGHIFLEHHQEANTDTLLKKNLSIGQYKKFENEANCYARNLLSPIPLVDRITDSTPRISIHDISDAFDISYTAARTRQNLYREDCRRMNGDYYNYFKSYNILFGYYSTNCNNGEIDISEFCKICGEKDSIFEKSINRTFYTGAQVNNEKRVVECPKCSNEIFSDEAKFCKICSTPLYNHCEGHPILDSFGNEMDRIYHISDGSARYCKECGSKTIYYNRGLLNNWEESTQLKYSEVSQHYNIVAEANGSKY
ncbi:ImmA/IrrE family metallo-endopeptidase [Bacillus sp. 2205SS5-2]|uniref:ImmA/IrrE family metallo-endopeptidase n=1 Tax=Bacillus sp. 2205SS5-2 TaxID=3109031 RepID=UPI0030046FF5